jgi:diguanylate cyclase (GGDEF)-like protein/PAS domain S-box-containing protein
MAPPGRVMSAPSEQIDDLLAVAIAHGPCGFLVLDDDGRVLRANRAACDLLRRDETSLLGTPLSELIDRSDRGPMELQLELVISGAIDRVRHELRLADGASETWVELAVQRTVLTPFASRYLVASVEDVSDRARRDRELRRLADTDPLTGLWNRRRFIAELELHLARTRRYGAAGAVMLLDIDELKHINDTHGHRTGDAAITATAAMLRSRLRSSDVIARIGGDEFAALLPAATEPDAASLCAAILDAIRTAPTAAPRELPTLSVGIALVTPSDLDPAGILERADQAMYATKRSGANDVAINHGADAWPHTRLRRTPAPTEQHTEISLLTLLQTLADLAEASTDLIAWEIDIDEPALTSAWSAAVREGLLDCVRYDKLEQHWIYTLTPAGHHRLRALLSEPDPDRPPPTPPPTPL